MTVVGGHVATATDPSIIAALDIGTNSFHLVVARQTPDGFDVLTREKEVIRLGHGGTDMKEISPDAIERAIACLGRMRRLAESNDASILRAVATSATREASNAEEFIGRALAEAGVEIDVISGIEEARLIYLGILQSVPIFDRRALCIDIGGGSTELIIGERSDMLAARSFKLGAVRLTDRFFPGGSVSGSAIRDCRSHIRSVLTHFDREVGTFGFDTVVASSGTAESLVRMAHLLHAESELKTYNCARMSAVDVHQVTEMLSAAKTTTRRVRIAGLDSDRADIALAGAVIMDEIVRRFGITEITFSEGALRDGVLLDTVQRRSQTEDTHLRDVARRSIRSLQERCDDDPAHSARVADLAMALFDGLADVHGLDPTARRHLEAAALLANVGLVVSHSKHHLHSYYVIRNSELAGLTDHEIEIIALIARYHRKSTPKPSHPGFADLGPADRHLVTMLAAILRVAIGLDRSHDGRVAEIGVTTDDRRLTIAVIPVAGADITLEIYAATERSDLLAEVTGRQVEIIEASSDRTDTVEAG